MNKSAFIPRPPQRFLGVLLLGLATIFLSGCSEKTPEADSGNTTAHTPAAAHKNPADNHQKSTDSGTAAPKKSDSKSDSKPAPGGRPGMRGMGPQTVSVVYPVIQTVPITMTAAATLSSPNAVTLTPQISGTLQSVHVVSGQQVKAQQLLFSLDAAPFRTALNSAEAKLKGDLAQARYAEQQVKQLTPLVEKDYVTRQSYDQAVASAQAANAQVAQDQAAIQTTKINLSYTEIRAPISGRLGEISLQPGNLVQANSTALTTLVSTKNLLVNFSLPQSVLTDLRHEWPSMGQPGSNGKAATPGPHIDLLDDQAIKLLGQGHLSFIDNAINPTTGTIRLQGSITNDHDMLWPGQFVTARLTLKEIPHAEVLPATALQLGDQGSFVYLVRQGKAEILAVHPIRTQATEVALPAGSIPLDAAVIYPLPGRIAPGMAVQIKAPPKKPADSAASTPHHPREKTITAPQPTYGSPAEPSTDTRSKTEKNPPAAEHGTAR